MVTFLNYQQRLSLFVRGGRAGSNIQCRSRQPGCMTHYACSRLIQREYSSLRVICNRVALNLIVADSFCLASRLTGDKAD